MKFTKHSYLPLYINIGATDTKGIDYKILPSGPQDYQKKVFLIYDIPTYFQVETKDVNATLGIYKSKQYPGFSIDLENYTDLTDYLRKTFSKSSRYKLNKYKKRFENCFNISYEMYFGEISMETYDFIFENFRGLLQKRFDDKQITNNNLDPKEWKFYYEVTRPMILEKRASLYVIYNEQQPIGITLNFFSDEILFDAITVFDIDYAKFHLGSITIMKLLEWSLEQKMRTFDFSKGYFDYKARWADKKYDFEYHILYDKTSIRARLIALLIREFYDFKQLLRDKNVNEKLHRLTFWLKNRKKNDKGINHSFDEIHEDEVLGDYEEVDIREPNHSHLRTVAFDFLYLNNVCLSELKVYHLPDSENKYFLSTETKKVMATLEYQS
ncbi:GNAT family N-acetyltransferase [Pareuzebyella sediminis]|uniref:GNAT family N-acetyltransferase n=1 Tax=Pareuzebyella sediminis TaxID=2607998 RepID=UPI0011EFD51C|nr:GNAT family N-acetyltransferase [Pareuzebyella sediminis]